MKNALLKCNAKEIAKKYTFALQKVQFSKLMLYTFEKLSQSGGENL